MSERNDIKTLHVELPSEEFDAVKSAADAEHRTLKGEVRRLIREAYGITDEREQPVASQTAAT